MTFRSETAANVAVCCMAVVVGLTALWNGLDRTGTATRSTGSAIVPYDVGDEFDLPLGLSFAEESPTLLAVVRSTCRFCVESIPFYRRLIEARGQGSLDFRFVAISLEPVDVARTFFADHRLQADSIVAYPLDQRMRFTGTPTLLVVDGSSRILALWRGQLTAAEERAVESFLRVSGN